jgi:hypothetical protein
LSGRHYLVGRYDSEGEAATAYKQVCREKIR